MHISLKFNKNTGLFFAAYVFYYSGLIVQHTAAPFASIAKSLFSILAVLILGLHVITNEDFKIKKRKIFTYIILLFVAVCAVLAKDLFVLVLLLFALASKRLSDKDMDKLFKDSILLMTIITFITVLLCLLGFIPNLISTRVYGSEPRWSYGFEHSQTISLLYLYAVLYYYILKQKVNFISFMVVQVTAIFMAYFFDARNGLYSIEVFFFLWGFYSLFKKIFKKRIITDIVYRYGGYSFTVFASISFLLIFLYIRGNAIASLIDHALTGRVSLALRTFSVYPIKIINIMSFDEYKSTLQSTIDNGYYYIAYRYGYVYLLLLLIVGWLVVSYFKRVKNDLGAMAIITISVSCAIANGFASCYFFPFWVVAFYELNRRIRIRGLGYK